MEDEGEVKYLEEPVFENLSIYDNLMGPRCEPHDRIKLFNPNDYEKFTRAWLMFVK